ncbi:unnamed protein product, partial [marine sediment metagenome]
MSLNPSKIDYLLQAKDAINRPGYTLNIITGCKHGCEYCYARRMVEHGRLKGHPSYPYGFEPTFHPERIRKYGGKPKLLFLNDMGDVGGDWKWNAVVPNNKGFGPSKLWQGGSPEYMAMQIRRFALLNPQHIILLLTKRPEWYGLAEWPDNVWCGFTATNKKQFLLGCIDLFKALNGNVSRTWISLEPWLDE